MATAEPEVPVTEQPPPAEKPVKEKKPKEKKEKKPKQLKSAAHPPYFQMIKEALLALKDKSGSSPYAIAKYVEEKHKGALPANFRKILALQIKNLAAKSKLMKVKASYKLSAEAPKKGKVTATKAKTEKKATKVAAAKPKKATKVTAAKPKKATKAAAAKPKKAEATKKPIKRVGAKKKSTPAKPKQPKSIKSPATKRAKKATA